MYERFEVEFTEVQCLDLSDAQQLQTLVIIAECCMLSHLTDLPKMFSCFGGNVTLKVSALYQ